MHISHHVMVLGASGCAVAVGQIKFSFEGLGSHLDSYRKISMDHF